MAKEDLADRDREYAVICIASGMLFLMIANPFEAVIIFLFHASLLQTGRTKCDG